MNDWEKPETWEKMTVGIGALLGGIAKLKSAMAKKKPGKGKPDFKGNLIVLTDKEGVMMGPGTWAKRGAATDQNEGYARDLGRNVNRAVVELILKGIIPPTLRFPWGMDREYYDGDGKAVFRVRKVADGRRVVLHPEPPHDIKFYLPRSSKRFDLREDGYSYKYVPGATELQEAAKYIFRLHFIDGVGYYRIARWLNDRGVQSPNGMPWSVSAVKAVLCNPLWIGLPRRLRRVHIGLETCRPEGPSTQCKDGSVPKQGS